MEDKILSRQQALKMCLMENLSIGFFIIPYVCVRIGGKAHTSALIAGMLVMCAYIFIMFVYSKLFDGNYLSDMKSCLTWKAKPLFIIYAIRYYLKAALIISVFCLIVRQYGLKDINIWWIIVMFLFVCLYGSSRSMKKRGQMHEALFWWMFVPLILAAVGAINIIDWNMLSTEIRFTPINNGLKAGMYLLFSMSGLELLLFGLGKQEDNSLNNTIKIVIWILFSVSLLYLYAFGIMGGSWINDLGNGNLITQSSYFPARLIRGYDLFSLMFLMVGAFSIASAFIYYAKEMIKKLFNNEETMTHMKLNSISLVILAAIIFLFVHYGINSLSKQIISIIIYADLAFGLLIPIIVWGVKKYVK